MSMEQLDGSVVHLEWKNVAIASTLLFVNGLISLWFGLGLERTLLVSALRCIVQLTIMGYVLEPIFSNDGPLFVFPFAFLLMFVSAIEIVYNKSKFRHDWMFGSVLFSMVLSTGMVNYIGNAYAIGAAPWFGAREFIPTLGMLLGNSMAGVAVGLNSTMSQLTDKKERIEMYLAFGATTWEAARPVAIEAIKLALLPTLNAMSVMGLISIPGMMTGQILGGTPIADAVRYQQIIMFMIVASCSIATVVTVLVCIYVTFDQKSRLLVDRIKKVERKRSTIALWQERIESLLKSAVRSRHGDTHEQRPLLG
ncbi:uncharacterized protein BJ171DRAFT_520104 [Polychytrium aggregatum]|uniref:uncharacterized protein n=1 Tax=Polychytrium aggregatum TaxID=110093 RepID=UPI0022FE205E|nr:uncharacterized protein BJ171DRAFT_520104 [Polychytrium aggregatum]KAI9197377.1 hypothetical protein BJ171DRAFT_520104 [Polychytrium aggregatum]